jgi:phytoene synthase
LIETYHMPRALPEALLEGLAWDGMERRYASLSDLRAYSARVASAVGAMMCVLMEVRDPHALARACDLGVAMQLTNIARDVGEDARAGRLYLPTDWLEEEGIDIDAFLADPRPTPRSADREASVWPRPIASISGRNPVSPACPVPFAPASSPRGIATTPSAES